jgi:hypothetical protein
MSVLHARLPQNRNIPVRVFPEREERFILIAALRNSVLVRIGARHAQMRHGIQGRKRIYTPVGNYLDVFMNGHIRPSRFQEGFGSLRKNVIAGQFEGLCEFQRG